MSKDLVHRPRTGEFGKVRVAQRPHLAFERAALNVIEAKRSKETKRAYKHDLAKWISFCISTDVDPLSPPLDAASDFRDHLLGVLAPPSVIRTLAAMSSVYRALMRGRAVRANPFHPAMLAWPQASSIGKTKAISAKVAKAMIAKAAGEDTRCGARDAALMQLLYDTGLRRSSVAQILRSKYVDGCITTIVKGDKEVELELPKASVTALERYLAGVPASSFLFPGKRGHIELSTINKILKARGNAVGAGHVHPHQFRAAFVTAAYDAELPEYEIQAAVHHADARTTRRYDRKARGRKVATRLADIRKDDE